MSYGRRQKGHMKDKPKNDPRKFGYKSKGLRHAIRQPDEQAALEAIEARKESEKKKFNKTNKDFVRNNRERFKPGEESQRAPSGQHITPGTVTLTQEQLAALLASLGKNVNTDGENPLKISFDASNNRIEVEKYDSSGSGDEGEVRTLQTRSKDRNGVDYDDDDSDVGIAAFLDKKEKPKAKQNYKSEEKENFRVRERRSREKHVEVERRETQPKVSHGEPSHRLNAPEPQTQSRLSLEEAKKEAGVDHVPDLVPWKHLTVGERKRLQWARERADMEEEYNPWGKPGAGAPQRKEEEETDQRAEPKPRQQATERRRPDVSSERRRPDVSSERRRPDVSSRAGNVNIDRKKKQDDLASEIEKLRREIQEAEDRKKQEEERLHKPTEGKARKREEERSEASRVQQDRKKVSVKKDTKDRGLRRSEKREEEPPSANGLDGLDDQVQIVIVRKKKPKEESRNDVGTDLIINVHSSTEEPSQSEEMRTETKQKSRKRGVERAESPTSEPQEGSGMKKSTEKGKPASDKTSSDAKAAAQVVLTV